MNRVSTKFAALAALLLCGLVGTTWAQQSSCIAPSSSCTGGNVTTSQVQIGGPGSISSNNTIPATCDGGTPGNLISARLDFSFDRAAGTLTVIATNTTQAPHQGVLTGFAFNVTSDVTLMTLASTTGSALTWSGAFDRDRTDNVMEVPAGNGNIKCDGFGRFNVFSGNNGADTGFGGGNPNEILPGNAVTFVFNVSGNLANVTACSFTSVASLIPPGDKTSIAVGRFQACNGGGSAWAGPCVPNDLPVELVGFEATDVDDSRVALRWETASEIDNAGFAVLQQGARDRQYVRLQENLIPAEGTPTSGAIYTYVHDTAVNGKKIRLRLEDWDFDGNNTLHVNETIEVVPNPKNPPTKLLGPAYAAALSRKGAVTLQWGIVTSTSRRVIQISGDPTFPAAGTMEINAGSTTSRTLSKKEKGLAEELALAGDGGIYWRIKGQSEKGITVYSDVFVFELTD